MDEYEVIGFDDDDEEVGALRLPFNLFRGRGGNRVVRARRRRPVSVARARTMGSTIVASPQRKRMLPLGTVTVAAAGSNSLQATCQKAIQPDRLILTSTGTAGAVTVTDIKIGVNSQLAGTEAMPLAAFSEDSLAKLELDPVSTGMDVTVNLSNSDATTAALVAGVMIGVGAD